VEIAVSAVSADVKPAKRPF